MQNRIIVNADDFGLTESCSKAIAEAFKQNLISSTTACANGEYIERAFMLAEEYGFSDKVCIHLNLTEGTPITGAIKQDVFFCQDGVFHDKINRLKKPTKSQLANIETELTAQIERLKRIGFNITHADSHHHIHTDVFFENTIKNVLFAYGIKKIRLHRNFGDIKIYKKVVKSLYNRKLHQQGFTTCDKMGSLEDLTKYPETVKGWLCEIMVHPDFDKDGKIIDRIGWDEDGYPIGQDLHEICRYTSGLKPISYREL